MGCLVLIVFVVVLAVIYVVGLCLWVGFGLGVSC